MSSRQFYFIGDSGPSEQVFRASVDAAVAGDDAKLAYVIRLVRFSDGEAALNFGDLLLQIRRAAGVSRFERVMATLPNDVQESANGCMAAFEGTARAYQDYERWVREHRRPN